MSSDSDSQHNDSLPERYRKQTLFRGIGEQGQQRLRESRVTLVGCGALGSTIAESLVRAGVGFLRIADRDFVELSNLQRQVLFDEQDVKDRLPKVIAAQKKLMRINSDCVVEPHVADVTHANVLDLIADADLILDGTDNFETRFLLNDAAAERNIPWVHAGCVGSHGQVMSIIPGQTPCLRCLMPEIPGPGRSETCDTAGVIGPAIQIMASLQVVDALKILTGQRESIRPVMTIVDVWESAWRQINLQGLLAQQNCPCCHHGERLWLEGAAGSQSTILCGRNSVQISSVVREKLLLPQLAAKLERSGTVKQNPFLLVFHPSDSPYEITIFGDGRAIISGTEDLHVAKGLYSRFIGQ
ncbi:ThiF family adenylyltransferase [Planctomicrobium sp. SH668]|uniref:ThiF family adenylyltransferase n=1 Tax=Planctomicrobium sp. SH668 TaxID=3448126 RepID=UPI003F5BA1F0